MGEAVNWQRPRGCSTNECIEVRIWPKAVEIRSARDGERVLNRVMVSPAEWRTFVAAVKAGEYD